MRFSITFLLVFTTWVAVNVAAIAWLQRQPGAKAEDTLLVVAAAFYIVGTFCVLINKP